MEAVEKQETSAVTEQGAEKKRRLPKLGGKKGKKGRWKKLAALVLAAAVVIGAVKVLGGGETAPVSAYTPAPVSRQDIRVGVTGTATLEAADSYKVSTLVSGEIQSAPFEELSDVTAGDLLYSIDASAAQNSVTSAAIGVKEAQMAYDQLARSKAPAAPIAGVINEIYVKDGDTITAGTALCKIISSTEITADFTFTYVSPSDFYIGQSATVFISGYAGSVQGRVSAVSDATALTASGQQSCTVRVTIDNAGALTDNQSYTAQAVIGSHSSARNTPLRMGGAATVTADAGGTVSGFSKLVGSSVTAGETLCAISSDELDDQIESARLRIQTARLSQSNAQDSMEDYQIVSPISGTVIEKNFKAGDKVDGAESGTLAVVFDLSYLKMQMPVNELDIGKVAVGQTVEVTASALPGQVFTGVVEKVSINGTTTNGFTTYPVTIRLDEYGELKPGMNVSADILCQSVSDALCVPVAAVARGNTVQVALPGALAEDGVTVTDETKIETRTVTIGVNDDAYIQITSGLEEGETVLLAAAPGEQ